MLNIKNIPLTKMQLREVNQETKECISYMVELGIIDMMCIDNTYYDVICYVDNVVSDWNKLLVINK